MSNTEKRASFEHWARSMYLLLDGAQYGVAPNVAWVYADFNTDTAYKAYCAALSAQSAVQEPVAWLHEWHDGPRKIEVISRYPNAPTHYASTSAPLYTHPSSAAQVRISDEAIFAILLKHGIGWETGTGVMESLALDDESGPTFLAAIREVLANAGAAQVEEIRNADLFELFSQAIAWGRVYGDAIPAHQWDEMRDQMALQFQSGAKVRSEAEKSLLGLANDVCKHYWQFGADVAFEDHVTALKVCVTAIRALKTAAPSKGEGS